MNDHLKHLEAIAKWSPYPQRMGPLWTNSHIAVKADFPGKDGLVKLAQMWNSASDPAYDSTAYIGGLFLSRYTFCREIMSAGQRVAFIDEAYRLALSPPDAAIYLSSDEDLILFRVAGTLVGIAKPITHVNTERFVNAATEREIFESFACEENGWYLQPESVVRRLLKKELDSARRAVWGAQETIEEAKDEAEEATAALVDIEKKIGALAGMTFAPEVQL